MHIGNVSLYYSQPSALYPSVDLACLFLVLIHWPYTPLLTLQYVRVYFARIFRTAKRLNGILGFVLYGMAACLGMKPSAQATSTRLCCEITVHSWFNSTRNFTIRYSYFMLFLPQRRHLCMLYTPAMVDVSPHTPAMVDVNG